MNETDIFSLLASLSLRWSSARPSIRSPVPLLFVCVHRKSFAPLWATAARRSLERNSGAWRSSSRSTPCTKILWSERVDGRIPCYPVRDVSRSFRFQAGFKLLLNRAGGKQRSTCRIKRCTTLSSCQSSNEDTIYWSSHITQLPVNHHHGHSSSSRQAFTTMSSERYLLSPFFLPFR